MKQTKPWVIANWKMNPVNQAEVLSLLSSLTNQLADDDIAILPNILLSPSFIHLTMVKDALKTCEKIGLSAQNLCGENADKGAFTGEISASQLQDLGVEAVIIGHSERRQYFAEDNACLVKKIDNAFKHGLTVIFCIGETKSQYESQQTQSVLAEQLVILQSFQQKLVKDSNQAKLVIAYEPVWAIGTGLTPTLDEIASVHTFIHEQLQSLQIDAPIVYGGSVNAKNASDLSKIELVDGVLVGGASLVATDFYQIIQAFGGSTV